MPSPVYFAYGSNLDEGQMRGRCPGGRVAGVAMLPDHVLAFAGHSEACDGATATVIASAGARVPGLLYVLGEVDWRRLDRREGFPTVYAKRSVVVCDAQDARVGVTTYVHTRPAGGQPGRGYLERIRKAYAGLGFDEVPLLLAAGDLMRLFVYGTLRRGESNHRWMSGLRCLGVARTRAAYTRLELGAYPGLLEGGQDEVPGELYAVDAAALDRLDRFEGHPTLFERRPIGLSDGSSAEAYLYRGG